MWYQSWLACFPQIHSIYKLHQSSKNIISYTQCEHYSIVKVNNNCNHIVYSEGNIYHGTIITILHWLETYKITAIDQLYQMLRVYMTKFL